ncbi:MAG: hypothetical protein RLZZ242_1094 [Bacteroidota bacterium]|jgi:diaminohydroxyphosphoribosylaminopyrimidine deaminase/5-amino-6-(5-phosphoribosylamino)uracil reductase
MRRALQLALRGVYHSSPNPSVGCVIVHRNTIIGEGYTSRYGGAHAEINAIESIQPSHRALLPASTVYVTLEPCAHFGKTPPCALRLVKEGVKEVVIGVEDPNPKVAGKGIALLNEAQIKTHLGILSEECAHHHRHFLKSIQHRRSFVTLKWAESEDGIFAPLSSDTSPEEITWISSNWSRQYAHKLRAQHSAIIVGSTTFLKDEPKLTTRHWAGNTPTPFILTSDTRFLHETFHPNLSNFSILFIHNHLTSTPSPIEKSSSRVLWAKSLKEGLEQLYAFGYPSVLIEGGAATLQNFIDQNLWDEIVVFKASKKRYTGLKAPKYEELKKKERSGEDVVLHALNRKKFID